jgi:hypothetical protein
MKIIYLEDTITLLANLSKFDLLKELSKIGEFKETKDGYRYLLINEENENEEVSK